jgi:hypothetical protein
VKYAPTDTRKCVACHQPVSLTETLDSWFTFDDYEYKLLPTEQIDDNGYWFIAADMPPVADAGMQDLYGLHNNLSCRAIHITFEEMPDATTS